MTDDEIKSLEQDIEWDAIYLDVLGLDYGSRIQEVRYSVHKGV
jgi:hypothetical protein